MMKRFQRLLSLTLSAAMSLMMGATALASGDFATVSTTLDGMGAKPGEELSFQVSTEGFYGQGMVIGKFSVTRDGEDAKDAYEIRYLETADGPDQGKWLPLTTDFFGPAGSGFPFSSATSEFQVTFHREGVYRVLISIVDFSDNSIEICRTEAEVRVAKKESEPSGDGDAVEPDPQEIQNAAAIDAVRETLTANADTINEAFKLAQGLAHTNPESAVEIGGAPFLLAGSPAARAYEWVAGEAGFAVETISYAGKEIIAPVIELDVKSIDYIPWTLVDALAGKCVFLRLSGVGETYDLLGLRVEKTAENRVFYNISDLVERYGE